ncbi:MAG: right-handed parallel beta-helix repeat-containing protein [Planctomycetes bacterium]|nr:right-handed parallel beta-helix repeat-containing protein [Planctomycetota bacterium]
MNAINPKYAAQLGYAIRGAMLLSWLCSAGAAAQFVVDPSGSGTHLTIQSAIDDATDGVEIIVTPSIYLENINFLGKAITVRSTAPTDPDVVEATQVDGQAGGHVVIFDSGEGSDSLIEGLTITNGNDTYGGGIYCVNGSSPTIRLNQITDNFTVLHGTAIYCAEGASPLILDNEITDNVSEGRGAGIYVEFASPRIEGNLIDGNFTHGSSGGGIHLGEGTDGVVIVDNDITHNTAVFGGGLNIEDSAPKVWRNRIIGNIGSQRAGGLSLIDAAPAVENNIIAGNWSIFGAAVDCNNATPIFRGNAFVGNWADDSAVILLINGSDAHFAGNIIAHHPFGVAIHAVFGATANAEANCFFDNPGGDFTGEVELGDANIYVDPKIVALGEWKIPGDDVNIARGDGGYTVVADLAGLEGMEGISEYRLEPDRERFQVDVANFEPGTTHDIFLNGDWVGQISIDNAGMGEMEYDTNDGNFPPWFPQVFEGDIVNVGGLVTGIFGPEGGGTTMVWLLGDEHLQPTSPCIDAWSIDETIGDDLDIDGQIRSYSSGVDIGSDEIVPSGTGDFDGDGDVDLVDFGMLQVCFAGANGEPIDPTCIPGDFDDDGDIDLLDYAAFQAALTGPT